MNVKVYDAALLENGHVTKRFQRSFATWQKASHVNEATLLAAKVLNSRYDGA